MPHSSGGGSHGGGSHGGSHRSSHSSGSGKRISKTYFGGARTYVRYKNNSAEYIYATSDIKKPRSKARFLMIVFYLPFIFFIFVLISALFFPPSKIVDNCNFKNEIDDKMHAISDPDMLMTKLDDFYEQTGISVCIKTVLDSAWKGKFTSLEKYAYAEYVKKYEEDENHWMFIYSMPEIYSDDFVGWSWEGMQGNNTDRIITPDFANEFTEKLHNYLLSENSYDLCSAFCKAFEDMTPKTMKAHFDIGMFIAFLILTGFICVHMYFMVFYDPSKKYADYKYAGIDNAVQEAVCNYCRGVYVIGTCISCPHCGAPLEHLNN